MRVRRRRAGNERPHSCATAGGEETVTGWERLREGADRAPRQPRGCCDHSRPRDRCLALSSNQPAPGRVCVWARACVFRVQVLR